MADGAEGAAPAAVGATAVGAVVLAAGGSRRLGSPKQLVEYRGVALVRRAAEAALAAGVAPVVVVLGADAARVGDALAGLPVRCVVNEAWEAGVAGSIRLGVAALRAVADGSTAVLVTLADQPLVDATALARLLAAYRAGGRPLAAAAYDGTVGVPAVFGTEYAARLAALPDGDRGAGPLLRAAPPERVTLVPMDEAACDVDTAADAARLADAGPGA